MSRTDQGSTGRLPDAPAALIGRDAELADLGRALRAPGTRLVTLTGPPGVGKTRLALATAHAVAPAFRDGVVLVDLAPVRDPALVIVELARALGLREASGGSVSGRVAHALADRELLLVVDNCEQVLAAGPELVAPLRTCPGLRLLVTSRERLHLGVEREVPVRPLALPAPNGTTDPARLAGVPAVALLVARIRSIEPDFALTAGNAAAVAEICRRLDGLPLALELAAARAKLFTPAELAARLRQRMTLLTRNARDAPVRHASLRTALEWSHDLLEPDERALFRRLSVFVGGWTLDAADQVCGGPGIDVLEAVGSLVDKSLVRRRAPRAETGEFALLESLREFAAELLADHDDREVTRDRHAAYFAAAAHGLEARIGLAAEADWWSATTASAEANLQEAFEHALASADAAAALPLATALGWHAYFRGHLGAGRDQLDRALAVTGDDPAPGAAGACTIAGVLAWTVGDLERASVLLGRALALGEAVGDHRRTAVASSFLGHAARAGGRYDEAQALHERAAELYRQLPSRSGYAWTRYDLGLLARRRGELDTAARHLHDGLTLFRELDYGWAIGRCAWALAAVGLRRSATDDAGPLLAEALTRHEEVGDGRGLAQCLESAAALAAARGLPEVAAPLLGAAAEQRRRLAAPLPEEDRDDHQAVVRDVRAALGSIPADRAWDVGRSTAVAAAVALARGALGEPVPRGGPAPPTPTDAASPTPTAATATRPASPLTGREGQVADLVAAGRTNRQIGRALGIAEKTVEVHVHHVIAKLGARSRAEVAAWVAGRRG